MIFPSQPIEDQGRLKKKRGAYVAAAIAALLSGCEPMVWQMEGPKLEPAIGRCLQGGRVDTTMEGQSRKECLVKAVSERRAAASNSLVATLEASGFHCGYDRRQCRLSVTEKMNAMFGSSLRGSSYTITRWIVDISLSGKDTIGILQIHRQQDNHRDGQVSSYNSSTDGSVPTIR